MFSIFRKSGGQPSEKQGPDSLPPRRMGLEDRKAFRRELLYQAIKEALLSLEVSSSMYKFKVMNVDERHHRFVVMIDVTKSFQTRRLNRPPSFFDIEAFIKKKAFERYGIGIEGIYWRVSHSESPFVPSFLPADSADPPEAEVVRTSPAALSPDVVIESPQPAAHPFQSISELEKQAFMDAIKRGVSPPPIHVGNEEYQTDLTPLDGGELVAGSQFGKSQ